ncbi:unnamed protein product [Porites lobata]|uniref:Uncharacterized protein n=1 Tax=Porites lobata TaxID=104759 RepID=A0ABN8QFX7_9CNID|nr:unnamed protein product [Porites lobata]
MMAPKPMSTVQYTKNYSHNKMIIEIVNAADRIKGIIYPQKILCLHLFPWQENKFKGRQKREREVKNAEAEQTPQNRTGIFTQHQLFGLELEFELKEIVSNCNLVNPKLDLRFNTDEQNGGEKECYADLMLTAKGNFTLKSLLTGFIAIDIFMVDDQGNVEMVPTHKKKAKSTVQYTKNYSHNKMIIEIVNAADRIKGIIYPQKKVTENKFKGRQKREREVKNAEAEQTPQNRTGIFTQHQLFGLELEFELKEIVSNCNLVNPKLDLRFNTDEQNGGEKECYADLMLTAKGNFTLKSLLTGFIAIDIFMVDDQGNVEMVPTHKKKAKRFYCVHKDTVQYTKNYSHNKMIIEIVNAADRIKGIIYPQKKNKFKGRQKEKREVKNAEAEQTPQNRTGIFTQHQLFGLELEFELKEIVSNCNLVNPKLDLRFNTDEQNGGEKECYADLMLTAKGNFTLKSLLTGFIAIDIFMVDDQGNVEMVPTHKKKAKRFYCVHKDTVQYTKNYSHNKMIIEIVNAADRIKGIIYPQKKVTENKFKGRQKREREVKKNAEAEQPPQNRTGIFTQHQLFGLELEFELKEIVSNCNLVNPKLDLRFNTDEQNGGEKECYADLMLTAKGNFTLKKLVNWIYSH